jgi:acyl dehydratase
MTTYSAVIGVPGGRVLNADAFNDLSVGVVSIVADPGGVRVNFTAPVDEATALRVWERLTSDSDTQAAALSTLRGYVAANTTAIHDPATPTAEVAMRTQLNALIDLHAPQPNLVASP